MNADRVPYVTTITLMQQRSLAKLNDKVCSNASFSQPLIMGTLGTDATVHKTEESKSTVPRVVEKYEYSLDGFSSWGCQGHPTSIFGKYLIGR